MLGPKASDSKSEIFLGLVSHLGKRVGPMFMKADIMSSMTLLGRANVLLPLLKAIFMGPVRPSASSPVKSAQSMLVANFKVSRSSFYKIQVA